MRNNQVSRGLKILIAVIVLLRTGSHSRADQKDTSQAQALADIAAAMVTCSSHPCLGDGERSVRKELNNRIVSDEISYYSDFAAAYPSSRNSLAGVVEWDFDPELEMVSLKITGFSEEPSMFLSKPELALPGCEIEREDDVDPEAADDDEGESDATRTWSCLAEGSDSDDVLVEVYLIPGMVILEIGS